MVKIAGAGGAKAPGAGRVEPVALALERVGGQGDALGACAFEEGAPVELCPGGMGVCDRNGDRLCLGSSLAQGGDEGGLVLFFTQAIARLRPEDGVVAEPQITGGARLGEGLYGGGECRRVPRGSSHIDQA